MGDGTAEGGRPKVEDVSSKGSWRPSRGDVAELANVLSCNHVTSSPCSLSTASPQTAHQMRMGVPAKTSSVVADLRGDRDRGCLSSSGRRRTRAESSGYRWRRRWH